VRLLSWRGVAIVSALALVVFVRTSAAESATLGAIKAYRSYGSPVMQLVGVRCRFTPSCSRYAELAVQKYGVVRGLSKAGYRFLRCNPWGADIGTVDYP
jgi:putative membrane protein insertion efficiency factor